MSQMNWTLEEAIDRRREIAEARTQLAQLAEQQGVLPVSDVDELRGSDAPDDVGNDDVDGLLRLLREWQDEDLTTGGV